MNDRRRALCGLFALATSVCGLSVLVFFATIAPASAAKQSPVPVDLAPILQESSESTAISDAKFIKYCMAVFQKFAAEEHGTLGRPKITRSARGIEIVRASVLAARFGTSARFVCYGKNFEIGVAPLGPEELIPTKFLGMWAPHRLCSDSSKRLAISAIAMQVGASRPFEVRYFPSGDGKGHGEFWTTDGTFWVPVYDAKRDQMSFRNTWFSRCPAKGT